MLFPYLPLLKSFFAFVFTYWITACVLWIIDCFLDRPLLKSLFVSTFFWQFDLISSLFVYFCILDYFSCVDFVSINWIILHIDLKACIHLLNIT